MRIGIDIGGSKIEILALGPGGEECARHRVPTPAGSYTKTVMAVAKLVQAVEKKIGRRCSVGIGIPGALSRTSGLVKNANSTCLIGKPFDRDLSAALDRPVRVENDANCLALSEAADGAAAGVNVVFGAILGTGVGGGLAVTGQPVHGRNAIAGEWGHNPLPWPADDERPGPACYCGKNGCIETFLSGPGLAADFAADGAISAEEIATRADKDEPAACAAMERYHDRLTRALAGVINILDPDIIVLGGGLSNIATLYRELPLRLPRYVFSDEVTTPIVPARHGDSSGVRGAARLWGPPEEL